MAIIKVEVRLNYTSGLPADCAVNTFHFDSDGTGDIADVFTALEGFYNTANLGSAQAIRYSIGNIVSRTTDACEMFAYEVGVPGPPIAYNQWTLGSGQTSQKQLPYEVACCLSYAGSTPGVPSARQRGRIYIGPLMENSLGAANSPPAVSSILHSAMEGSATLLMTTLLPEFTWVVYSRVNDAGYGITHGWIDDEFDTQRRRQKEATSRFTW